MKALHQKINGYAISKSIDHPSTLPPKCFGTVLHKSGTVSPEMLRDCKPSKGDFLMPFQKRYGTR
jgi:hypothetical protein